MYNITHITKELSGGAGTAAKNIYHSIPISIAKNFIISKNLITLDCPGTGNYIKYPKTIEEKIFIKLSYLKEKYIPLKRNSTEYISFGNPNFYLLIGQKTDLIHLHWVSDMIHFPLSFNNKRIPIVWTLHDMNPISGGCHYFLGCSKFEIGCTNCPQLSYNKHYNSVKNYFQKKVDFFSRNDIHLIATSNNTKHLIELSYLGKLAKSIKTIPISIDEERFSIIENKDYLRTLLGINSQKLILGIGANGINREIKGIKDFIGSLKRNKFKKDIILLIFGNGNILDLDLGELEYLYFGGISSDSLLNIIYSSLDFFVFFSREEAFGQTIIESLACGIPVLGRTSGCLLDIIEHKKNGFVLSNSNDEDLNEAIEFCIQNKTEFKPQQLRENVLRKFSNKRLGLEYFKLYHNILNNTYNKG